MRRGKRKWGYRKYPQKILRVVWSAIYRCTNPAHPQYHYYGERGIAVCAAWMDDKVAFVEYLMTLQGWNDPDLVIDRINNDGNYEPGNLRWVTRSVSVTNQRKTPRSPNSMFAECYKRLHDKGATYTEIADLYCVDWQSVGLAIRKLEGRHK